MTGQQAKPTVKRCARWVLAGTLLAASPAATVAQLTLQQALEVRRPGSLALSPDGSRIAFVVSMARLETNAYEATLFVGPAAGREQRAVAHAQVISAVDWSPDGESLTYLARSSGPYQAWTVRYDGTGARQLTHHQAGVAAGMTDEYVQLLRPFRLAPNGARALYFVRDSIAALAQWQAEEAGYIVYSPDVPMWALRRWTRQPAAAPQLWVVNLESGEERRAWSAPGSPLSPLPIEFAWSPDSRHVAILYEYLGDPWIRRNRLALLTGDDLQAIEALPQLGTSVFLSWTPDSREVRFLSQGLVRSPVDMHYDFNRHRYEVATARLERLADDATSENEHADLIARAAGDTVNGCTSDPGETRIACIRETGTVPPEVVTYARSGSAVARAVVLTDMNPAVRQVHLGRVEPLRWQLANGDTGTSGLVLPPGYRAGTRVPLVVMLYNQYMPSRFTGTAYFTSYAPQTFAARGYAVILQNNPYNVHAYGAGNFEEARALEADGVARSLRAMIDTLVVRGIADTTRMGIMGWSFGGFLGPYILTQYPGWFRAGAQGEGGNHQPSAYWMEGPAWRTQEDRYFGAGGPYGPHADRWRAVAPIHNVDQLRAPLLMEYSPAYAYGIELQRAILDQGGEAELVIYPDEDHVFHGPANRYASMMRHYDWFNFWLLGEEDPDPAKGDQYARWRAMRERVSSRSAAASERAP